MKKAELLLERVLLGCRWLLVVFYLGLAVGLGAYAVNFLAKLFDLWSHVLGLSPEQVLLTMLSLIDATLVAGLTVMVMISGYENFVSHFDQAEAEGAWKPAWLGKLDVGGIKLKVATAIVAISSISLLEVFLNVGQYTEWEVRWSATIHIIFVISALLLGLLERFPVIWKGDPHS
jgi:uncharacterized protein (TIGR00645 family)